MDNLSSVQRGVPSIMAVFHFSQRKAIVDSFVTYCVSTGRYPSIEGFLIWLSNSKMGIEVIKQLREIHLEREGISE